MEGKSETKECLCTLLFFGVRIPLYSEDNKNKIGWFAQSQ